MRLYTNTFTAAQVFAEQLRHDNGVRLAQATNGTLTITAHGEPVLEVYGYPRGHTIRLGEWVGHRPDEHTWLTYADWAFNLLYRESLSQPVA